MNVTNHSYTPGREIGGQDKTGFIWIGDQEVINITIDFLEPHQEFGVYGILLGSADKSLQINVNVIHRAVSTTSKVVLKGILTEKSSVKFNGITRIEHGAKQTNAWLECRLLLLSDQAKGQAIPALEILENDVKAGHASTAGKISDLELFYLRSRGLSVRDSKKLIAEGFTSSILDHGNFGVISKQNLKRQLNTLNYD